MGLEKKIQLVPEALRGPVVVIFSTIVLETIGPDLGVSPLEVPFLELLIVATAFLGGPRVPTLAGLTAVMVLVISFLVPGGMLRGAPSHDLILSIITLLVATVLISMLTNSLRKSSQEALRLRDSKHLLELQTIFENTAIGIMILERDGERIDRINSKMIEIIGYREDDLKGSHLDKIIHPDDTSLLKTAFMDIKADGGKQSSMEIRFLKKDGSSAWVKCIPSTISSQDHSRRIICIVQDVNEKKTAADDLVLAREQQRRWVESVLDLVPCGILLIEMGTGRIIYANQSASRSDPTSIQTGAGENSKELGVATDKTGKPIVIHDLPRYRVARGEILSGFEMTINLEDRESRSLLLHSALMQAMPGNAAVGIMAIQDISRQREVESAYLNAKDMAEKANSIKSVFLANMSHEIRTPLGAIVGFSQLLRDETIDISERRRFVDTILRSGSDLTRLIDDILDLSKVEVGRLEIEKITIKTFDFMADLRRSFSLGAEEKSLGLNLYGRGLIPAKMVSDPTRLRQIFHNLIGNAIKFTEEGKVDVELEFKFDSQKDNREALVILKVTDTGRGLTKEQSERLFKPFSQADSSTTRKYGGTGLGLVLSKKLANLLGGDVRLLNSTHGTGSTFEATISITIPDDDLFFGTPGGLLTFSDEEAAPSPQPSVAFDFSQLKILVAEDVTENQVFLQHLLKSTGAGVVFVNNGVSALKEALTNNYDLLLIDIQMPELDGYGVVDGLKAAGYKKPVVALTAYAMVSDMEKSRKAGFDEHVSKPVNVDQLFKIIKALTS